MGNLNVNQSDCNPDILNFSQKYMFVKNRHTPREALQLTLEQADPSRPLQFT